MMARKTRKDFRVHVMVTSEKLDHIQILVMRVGEFTEEKAKESCIAEAQRLYPGKKATVTKIKEVKHVDCPR